MPVRIYDIAKHLGITSKEVIAKAKELGIANAKVASSSLDKITAEYLEEQLGGPKKPEEIAASQAVEATKAKTKPKTKREKKAAARTELTEAKPPSKEPSETKPIEILTAEEPAAEPTKEAESDQQVQTPDAGSTIEIITQADVPSEAATVEPPAEPEPAPPEPEEPPKPKLGEKIGFIQLPTRPAPRATRPSRQQDKDRTSAPKRQGAPGKRAVQDTSGDRARPRPAPKTRDETPPPAPAGKQFVAPRDAEMITLKPPIIVRELAQLIRRKPFQLIADLMELNVFATVNQAIDEETAQNICAKHGFRFEIEKREKGAGVTKQVEKVKLDVQDKEEELTLRAPVVTIMGHVDHGKTTILDAIRKSNVVSGEAGGITQHIGAYTIHFPHPEHKERIQQITFLDTPGHAAFSAMRARGADVTDIVILVVAANDGVMPQTIEALNHAKAAEVPIIVAVNKIDAPNANPTKARQQLQDRGLMCEEWGGDTIFVDVSALKKEGIDKLLEMVLLQAEVMELKANPNRPAVGNVIESGMQQGGPTATVLVRKGTLKVGDAIICGNYWGKVKALINEEGQRLKKAEPSVAVKVLGLNGVPEAGVEFNVVKNEKQARKLGEERSTDARAKAAEARRAVTLENLFETLKADSAKVLKVVVKADAQGSVEAIVDALNKLDSEKVSIEVIHSGVGSITESDINLASASAAIVIGFHTRLDTGISEVAKRHGVQIKLYSIIYELIDEIRDAMAGLLDPVSKESVVGTAEVRQVFQLSKGGNAAGCMVTDGKIIRGKIRVTRNNSLIYDGAILSLRRVHDDVNEVRSGFDCGIRVDGFNDIKEGDILQSYVLEKVAAEL